MKKIKFSILLLSFFLQITFSQITPIGTEDLVNVTTSNIQQNPSISTDPNGNYVVVWESNGQDGSGFGIYAQIYASDGTVSVSEFLVNTTTNNDQRFPAVAMDNSGNFTVVWQSLNQDGDGWGIYARRYDNTGTAISGQTLVNTTTTGPQRFPDIAMDDDGDYVIVWESDFDIYLQRYNNAGVAQGAETLVNATTTDSQNYPAIAMDSDGDFVITWQSLGQDGDGFGIYAQRYNNAGMIQTAEFLVNTTTTDNQLSPDIAMDMDGNFTIVWVSNLQDGDREGIYAQQFDNTATAQNTEFLVNTTIANAQDNPAIGMSMNGDFIIAWNSYGQDGSFFGVYYKSYIAAGNNINPETLINTTTNRFQQFPVIGLDTKTTAAIVWQDGDVELNSNVDGNRYAVVQQRYDVVALPVELLYFTAKATEKEQVLLEWQTSSEINNKGFFLERSPNAKTWKTITFVEGAGTSVEAWDYGYLDEAPLSGTTYYRLKQVDMDDSFEYSEVRVVQLNKGTFKVSPNPVQDMLYYEFADWQRLRNIVLYNEVGQMVKAIYDLNGQINLKDLNAGAYILVANTAEGRFEVQFVKQ